MITNVISSAQELKDSLSVCGCSVTIGAAKRIMALFGKDGSTVTVTQLAEAVVNETDNMFGWLEANDPIVAAIALRDAFDETCGGKHEAFDELGYERREAFKWRYRARGTQVPRSRRRVSASPCCRRPAGSETRM